MLFRSGEQEMQVHPGLGVRRKHRRLQFARRQHHLPVAGVKPVAVDVHSEEFVVGPDFLQLCVGIHQRLHIPQADVVDGRAIGLKRGEIQPLLGRKRFDFDPRKAVGLSSQRDIVLDIGRLQL